MRRTIARKKGSRQSITLFVQKMVKFAMLIKIRRAKVVTTPSPREQMMTRPS